MGRFDNWYKRRINRIYPTVFAWAMVAAFVFGGEKPMDEIIIRGGGWFVTCIMMYYVVLYFVRKYLINRLWYVLVCVFVGCTVWYYCTEHPIDYNMYGDTYFKWFHYFMFMLAGSMMGISYTQQKEAHTALNVLKLIGCLIGFYALFIIGKSTSRIPALQIWSLIPLLGVVYYMYKVCNSDILKRLYNTKVGCWIIRLIGGLCLEIYLVQSSLFTDKMNCLFPLNIPIMFLIILFVAYLVRCLSRIFSQTFKDGEYDWKEVIRAF